MLHQVALAATDLDRATVFYRTLLDGSEWLAFIRDGEGNLVGLMTRYPAGDERPG